MESASPQHLARRLRQGGSVAALTASLMLGACGQTLSPGGDLLSLGTEQQGAHDKQAAAAPSAPAAGGGVSEDLLKATDYWGQAYAKAPRDLPAALNYARNLKAMGEKRRALAVLQQASLYHGQSRELASEYGRLALDLDQVAVAKQLLAIADDPAKPDWRIISARGAVLAKEGNYNDAIPYFERALALSHDQPSVLSNLALAYAMNGEPGKAEAMLRQAAAADGNSPRIRQNLALVLGLQGKYDEAKLVAARDMPINNATDNAEYLRQVVKLEPKSVPSSAPQTWETQSKVAELPVAAAVPVEKISHISDMPAAEPAAAQDTAWVVTAPDAPATVPAAQGAPEVQGAGWAATASNQRVLSVSEMAAKFAVGDEEPAQTATAGARSSRPAAAKR